MNIKQLLIRIGLYLTIVLTIFIILKTSGIKVSELSPEKIKEIANDNLFSILLIMLVIMCLQNLFTFIPLILVITINISLFGFFLGYLFSCFCSVIGSTIIFLSIRHFFPNLFKSTKISQYSEKVEENGFKFVLLGRVLPFLPTNIINIVSGLSSIRVRSFIMATTIGNMIYGFLLSSVSFGVIASFDKHPYLTIFALITVVVLYATFLYTKNIRKSKTV